MKKKSKKWIWILIIVVLITIGYLFFIWLFTITPPRIVSEAECRARLANQCVRCKVTDWTGKPEIDKTLQECAEKYWSNLMIGYKVSINFDDCSVMEQFCYKVVGDI